MTKRPMLTLLIAGLALGVGLPTIGGELPAAEDLFAKQTEALGGKALEGVKTMAVEFTFDMPAMGLSTTGESLVQVPDKSFSMISLAGVGTADFEAGVNGAIAWQNNPQMGLRILEGNERRMAMRSTSLDPFAGWTRYWDKAETVAEETVDGVACYKVVLTPPDGTPLAAWFDKETGLLVQEEMQIPEMGASILTMYSDYREIDGAKMAHRIEREGPMAYVIEYTSVRFNVDDIPEDSFALPEGVKAMAAE
jgi:hypothetical protein